jgi:hypothetical protein
MQNVQPFWTSYRSSQALHFSKISLICMHTKIKRLRFRKHSILYESWLNNSANQLVTFRFVTLNLVIVLGIVEVTFAQMRIWLALLPRNQVNWFMCQEGMLLVP